MKSPGTQYGEGTGSRVLFIGCLAVVLWAPLPFGSVEAWAIGVLRVVVFCLVGAWGVTSAVSGRLRVSRDVIQFVPYSAAILALFQFATGTSVDPFLSLQAAAGFLTLGLFLSLSLLSLDSAGRITIAANVLFWFGFALSVAAILQFLSGTHSVFWLRDSGVGSLYGTFVNKNHFAGLMELLLPIGLGQLAAGSIPRDRRTLTAFAVIIMGTAIVMSRSRTGMLCLAAQILFVGIWALVWRVSRGRDRQPAGLAVLLVTIVACIAVAVVWIGAEPVGDALSRLPSEIESTDLASRPMIWQATWDMFRASPIAGIGLGAYGTAITSHWHASELYVLLYAHNDYLQVLSDAGVIGAVLAILCLVSLLRSFIRGIQLTDSRLRGIALGVGAGCFGLLIHSFVDFNLQIPSNALAFLYSTALLSRSSSTFASRWDLVGQVV